MTKLAPAPPFLVRADHMCQSNCPPGQVFPKYLVCLCNNGSSRSSTYNIQKVYNVYYKWATDMLIMFSTVKGKVFTEAKTRNTAILTELLIMGAEYFPTGTAYN